MPCDDLQSKSERVSRPGFIFHGSFIMIRLSTIAIGMSLGLNLVASNATAQWGYPMGYGGYGMSRWGQDPASGYMAGLGSFARGAGSYQLSKAQADAINVDTMVKWNKALRARQLALRQEKQQEANRREVSREARVEQLELRDGTTLNNLLAQILDIDPSVSKSSRTDAPISASAIKEIPFEWDSEAVSVCLDQMTGKDSLPAPLMAPLYADERRCAARRGCACARRRCQGKRFTGSPQAD